MPPSNCHQQGHIILIHVQRQGANIRIGLVANYRWTVAEWKCTQCKVQRYSHSPIIVCRIACRPVISAWWNVSRKIVPCTAADACENLLNRRRARTHLTNSLTDGFQNFLQNILEIRAVTNSCFVEILVVGRQLGVLARWAVEVDKART